MADDILGHEHLDHGKHLHKHGHHHHTSPHWRHNTGHHMHGHGHHHGHALHGHTHVSVDYKKWLVASLVVLSIAYAVYNVSAGITALLLILVVNTLLEYHKVFTQGYPVDLEILTVGTAFIAATAGFFWGVVLAILGPMIAEISRGHMGEEPLYKSAALMITAAAGYLLGTSQWDLFIAVVFGILAYYIATAAQGNTSSIHNVLARLSTLALSVVVIYVFL
jgi:cobalt-zinc-cadmium efflux system protein